MSGFKTSDLSDKTRELEEVGDSLVSTNDKLVDLIAGQETIQEERRAAVQEAKRWRDSYS